jgi:zinc finger protein DZIP1
VHQVINESKFEKLNEFIQFAIESSVSNLFINTNILDPAIAKIFDLSQLSLQYILFCARFLDKSLVALRESVFEYQQEIIRHQEIIHNKNADIEQYRKKLKRQEALKSGIYPCKKCTKNFETNELLQAHMERKHASECKDKDLNLINTIKLELEIKQLKERLNTAEKKLIEANTCAKMECETCLKNKARVFKSIGIQINYEEKEKNDKEKEEIDEKLNAFDKNIKEFIENQMKQFKDQKVDVEIKEIKSILENTLLNQKESEKHKDPPLPTPRLKKDTEAPETHVAKNEDNLWKMRFEELEAMYRDNQNRMSTSIKDMEKTYIEKINNIEQSMKELQRPREELTLKQHVIEPKVQVKQCNIEDITSSESEKTLSSKEIEIKPIKLVEPVKNIKSIIPEIKMKKQPPAPLKVEKSNVTSVSKKDSLKKAEKLFITRLKNLNVPKHSKYLNDEELERINNEMIQLRDAAKKKHKSFFIVRKKVKSNVEQMVGRPKGKNAMKAQQKEEIDENVTDIRQKLEKVLQRQLSHEETAGKVQKKVLFNLDEQINEMSVKDENDSDFDLTSIEHDDKLI